MSEPANQNPKQPKRSRRRPAMEPLGWDEIVSQPGMGGYLSFLNGPVPLPHLQSPTDTGTDAEPGVDSTPAAVPTPVDELLSAAGSGSTATPGPIMSSAVVTPPVIEPTHTILGSVSTAEITSPPVDETITEPTEPGPETIPGVESATATTSLAGAVPTPGVVTTARLRIRRCLAAHDGHSLGEEVLYQALWKAAATESGETRTIVIGWRGMSQLCRMTPKNCKINTQRLIRKLALEVLSPYNTPESIGTTYRVYSSDAILRRRQDAGLEWVVRSRGVEFVDPATGLPHSAHSCDYVQG